jgi:hypothetical protein
MARSVTRLEGSRFGTQLKGLAIFIPSAGKAK